MDRSDGEAIEDRIASQPDVTVDVHSDKNDDEDDESSYKISHLIIPVFLLETMVVAALAFLAYQLRFTDLFPVYERGFFVDDHSLSYAYTADNFTTDAIVYSVAVILPAITFVVGEVVLWLFSINPRKVVRASCVGCKIHLLPRRLIRIIGTFILGALSTAVLVDVIKVMCCVPRPYFLSVCRPNITGSTSLVISDNVCTNTDKMALRQAMVSFPSFHAAISGYSAVFLAIYVHNIASMRGTIILRPVLIFTIIGASFLSGLTRMVNHKNHWQDIVIGYMMGAAIATYLTMLTLRKFRENLEDQPKSEDEDLKDIPLVYGSNMAPWVWIPRATYHKSGPRKLSYKNRTSRGLKSVRRQKLHEPNSAFQQDLHKRLVDLSTKGSTDQIADGY